VKQFVPSRSPCPIGRASRVLGDRWVLLIVREAMLGVTRFDDFIARTGINRAALTSRLALLIEAGLLERVPPDARRADYRLTDAGRALEPMMMALRDWGDRHLPLAAQTSRG
jgi:DNA-binding HxlR family transcriptional regulator